MAAKTTKEKKAKAPKVTYVTRILGGWNSDEYFHHASEDEALKEAAEAAVTDELDVEVYKLVKKVVRKETASDYLTQVNVTEIA